MQQTDHVDCSDLPKEWDGTETIRQRLRDGGKLVSQEKGKDVKIPKCSANYDVMVPILAQIGAGSRLAGIEDLRSAVSQVYSMNNRESSEDDVDDDAWDIRDMVSFIKRKTRREEVSKEFCLRVLTFYLGLLSGLWVFIWYASIPYDIENI